jgi:hypothetical protein
MPDLPFPAPGDLSNVFLLGRQEFSMNQQLLALLLGFALATRAEARLGDTQDQLVARYGPGANAGAATAAYPVSVMTFHKQNWYIIVKLINGISVGESFQKQGGPTDEDVTTLLALNSEGHEWKSATPNQTALQSLFHSFATERKAWQRDDGAYAFLPGPLLTALTIQSKQLLDADAAKADADKKAKESSLKGF